MSIGETGRVKPLFWMGSTHKDLKAFPGGPPGGRLRALSSSIGRKHLDAKVLKGFGGAGVLEVVSDHDGDTYRTVYTVKFAGAVYALHAFQKKSKKGIKTPPAELDIIRKRLKAAEEHDAKRRAEESQSSESSHR
jgi:phage-related protein